MFSANLQEQQEHQDWTIKECRKKAASKETSVSFLYQTLAQKKSPGSYSCAVSPPHSSRISTLILSLGYCLAWSPHVCKGFVQVLCQKAFRYLDWYSEFKIAPQAWFWVGVSVRDALQRTDSSPLPCLVPSLPGVDSRSAATLIGMEPLLKMEYAEASCLVSSTGW